jgi:hypothetical protein
MAYSNNLMFSIVDRAAKMAYEGGEVQPRIKI